MNLIQSIFSNVGKIISTPTPGFFKSLLILKAKELEIREKELESTKKQQSKGEERK